VLDNEFSGRYLRPNEGHNTPWYYYPVVLWRDYFMAFIVLLIAAAFAFKSSAQKQVYFRILMGVVLFLFILSLSATRIYWYVAPAIPLMAVLVVLPLADNQNRFFQASWKVVIVAIFVVGYFRNYHQNTTYDGVSASQVLMKAEKMGELPYSATWLVGHYHPVEKYYAAVLREKGLYLNISTGYDYKPQDTLIVSNMAHLDTLNRRFFMRQHHYPTHEMPVWVMVVDSSRIR
jgi:4-amino-4-deoxy-L-arabinose transferase-like glycosyltransferase